MKVTLTKRYKLPELVWGEENIPLYMLFTRSFIYCVSLNHPNVGLKRERTCQIIYLCRGGVRIVTRVWLHYTTSPPSLHLSKASNSKLHLVYIFLRSTWLYSKADLGVSTVFSRLHCRTFFWFMTSIFYKIEQKLSDFVPVHIVSEILASVVREREEQGVGRVHVLNLSVVYFVLWEIILFLSIGHGHEFIIVSFLQA